MEDDKSKLFKLLASIGHEGKVITEYRFYASHPNPNVHSCYLTVKLPNGLELHGYGTGVKKTQAEIAASRDAINKMQESYPELIVDWDKMNVDAQAGDALIKLAVYLSGNLKVSDNSSKLQKIEPNQRLAQMYDQWIADKDPDLAGWGTHMDVHRKASVVEALIWQRFHKLVITENANEHLKTLLKSIDL